MPNIDLITTETESLDSLVARQQEGFSVLRSAHVGNARAYNLALASIGVPMLLVDHTITGRDQNYRPEVIMRGTQERNIAELGQLSFRTLAVVDSSSQYLDEFHTGNMRKAFPETRIQTNTEYIRAHETVARELTAATVSVAPELFRRVVQREDAIATDDPEAALRMAANGEVVQLADDPRQERGALLPNEVDILAGFVIELIASGRDVQYHVSGPDMVKYMTQSRSREDSRTPLEVVNILYARLSSTASFRAQLPDTLTVKLVPGTAAKFATTTERGDALDGLLEKTNEAKNELEAVRQARGEFFRSPDSKVASVRESAIASFNAARAEAITSFNQAVDRCPDVFVGPKESPYISQYDVLEEGGMYVPDVVRAMSMAELTALEGDMRNIQRGKP